MNSNSYQRPSNPHHWNQTQNPYHQPYLDPRTQQLKQHTLSTVEPFVQYGLKEAQFTSYLHARSFIISKIKDGIVLIDSYLINSFLVT